LTGFAAKAAIASERPAAHHAQSVPRRMAWIASATKQTSTISLGSVE